MKTETQYYQLYTYDLWGNSRDGWQVNDVFRKETIEIKVKPVIYNKGLPGEFVTYEPTDIQLNRAIGWRGLVWEGESEFTLYASDKRNHKPVCELRRIK